MKSTDTQCALLKDALERGPINPLKALTDLGIYRLSARVLDLRSKGIDIKTRPLQVTNQFGEPTRVAEYYLED